MTEVTPSNQGTVQSEPPLILPELQPAGPSLSLCFTNMLMGLPVRLWDTVTLILLVMAADICLYGSPGGTGAAVLLIVILIGLTTAASPAGPVKTDRLFGVILLLLSLMAFWNYWGLIGFVAVLAVGGLAIRLREPDWSITEIAWSYVCSVWLAPFRLLGHGIALFGFRRDERSDQIGRSGVPLRAIVIPAAVVLVFIAIFMLANPVVSRMGRDVIDAIQRFFYGVTAPRVLSWVGWAMVFAALLRPHVASWVAKWLRKRPEGIEGTGEAVLGRGEMATAMTTLVSVNVLFLAYNLLDAYYLYFLGKMPAGISYSTYTHQGCSWLTVGLLLSTAVIGAIFRRDMMRHAGNGVVRVVAYVWAAQNLVLAAAALRRLEFYIDSSGLTRLRIVGLVGTLLVVSGLVIMVMKVHWRRSFIWIVRRDMWAMFFALLLLAVMPMDWVVWRYNTGLVLGGNVAPLSSLYRQRMSAEAFPALVPLLDHKEAWVQRGVAAILGERLDRLKAQKGEWTEWQASDAWARARLEKVQGRIDGIVPAAERDAAQRKFFEQVDKYAGPVSHGREGYDYWKSRFR